MCPSINRSRVYCGPATTDGPRTRGEKPVAAGVSDLPPSRNSGGPAPGHQRQGTSVRAPASERQGLGAPVDLGTPVLAERLDRRPRQRFVGREQPAEGFGFVKPAVVQHRQRPVQPLDDLVTVKERGGYRAFSARAGRGEQLAVAEELLHPAGGYAEPLGNLGE